MTILTPWPNKQMTHSAPPPPPRTPSLGDPSDHDPDKATFRRAFKGLARVIVEAAATPGNVVLHATAPGLTPAKIAFATVAAVR